MKRKLVITSVLLFAIVFSVFAGGVSAKSNLSTGWLRNPSRNTETKRPDSSIYNIAGTAFVDDGLYFEVGNQFISKENSHKVVSTAIPFLEEGEKFKDTDPVWLFPDFVALYKNNNWAASFNFTVVAGGGSVNYKEGTALTTAMFQDLPHSLKAKSVVFGETVTFAYKPVDWLSLSVGGRLLENSSSMNVKCSALENLDGGYKADGIGFGGIFGIHAKPIDALDLSLQYKTKVDIEMKLKDVDQMLRSLITATKYDSDVPAEIQAGLGYRIIDSVYASASFGYYFAEDAHQDSALGKDDWDNSWNLQFGVEWDVTDKLCLSVGLNHGEASSSEDQNSLFAPVVECNAIAAGAEYKFSDTLTGSLGAMYNFNKDKDYSTTIGPAPISYKVRSNALLCSIGLTYKPL